MIKKFTILIILFCFKGICQESQIIQIDRFDNNKNDWGITDTNKWLCKIENGKLVIENKVKNNWCYFHSKNLKNLENKAYTEITFDFQIKSPISEYGGAGIVFINDRNSKEFKRVRLLIREDITYFDKENWSYPNDGYVLGNSFNTTGLEKNNSVKIILNNSEDIEGKARLIFFLNDEKLYSSNWAISNFNKIGFVVQGLNQFEYDNLIIKQSVEKNYLEDALDYIYIDNKKLIDHNGIDESELIKFIPVELVDNQNILSTKDLIKSLKKNKNCSSIETKKVNFSGKKREMLSFNYGNSLIEFFTDTEKPNPIEINFLEKDDLDDFFKIYADYNSYRYDKNRAQWPSNPWFSILKFNDSYRATIWRGM
ncbi:hypothetical protein ES676_09745 [Bizionia saleffrena]|uniref:Uncharacterized protein n=1 Tax=Bizionia saleffrena TaxID=291189 RepID=A0A8H2QE42_9FLAO|nr:hypothetical protein [Bizionia saleffrena]TYB73031.1 hypothetical protein ES676_09745 [Bizionia saleffrena]